MFEIITKRDFFDWTDKGLCSLDRQELKNIQDGFVLSELASSRNAKILEMGGGVSRVLPRLDRSCELWNADRLEGDGNGPGVSNDDARIRLVKTFLGEFSAEMPSEYFDAVFSVSVVEHIPESAIAAMVDDTIRILRPGGIAIHAVDLNIGDADMQSHVQFINQEKKIRNYLDATNGRLGKIQWLRTPTIKFPVIASATFAANSVNTQYRWAKRFPQRRASREMSQSVSLKWGYRKSV